VVSVIERRDLDVTRHSHA